MTRSWNTSKISLPRLTNADAHTSAGNRSAKRRIITRSLFPADARVRCISSSSCFPFLVTEYLTVVPTPSGPAPLEKALLQQAPEQRVHSPRPGSPRAFRFVLDGPHYRVPGLLALRQHRQYVEPEDTSRHGLRVNPLLRSRTLHIVTIVGRPAYIRNRYYYRVTKPILISY